MTASDPTLRPGPGAGPGAGSGRLPVLPDERRPALGERPEIAVERLRRWRVSGGEATAESDAVAREEPLEIHLVAGDQERTVAVTMRTPGHDPELAAGFLFAEGVIAGPDDLLRVSACRDPADEATAAAGGCDNVVYAELAASELPDLAPLERHFFATSACGVCGKAGLETLSLRGCRPAAPGPVVERAVLTSLPKRLRRGQGVFDATGGLHAAALFTAAGELLAVREDVGRHNALDKLIGWALGAGRVPLADSVVMVSGRASFELLQKCLVAGVPIVCAVSAPSSLAVEVARGFRMTLVGFLRGDRFNVYTHPERIAGLPTGV